MVVSSPRNWSAYNAALRGHGRLDLFITADELQHWAWCGPRKPGGKLLYSDRVIEICYIVREYFGLGLRQTEGFLQSLLDKLQLGLKAPDYTTLSRRLASIDVTLQPLTDNGHSLVLAVDSTGLSVLNRGEWNRLKHRKADYSFSAKWRKLHIVIDVGSGQILNADYSSATTQDGEKLAHLLDGIEVPIERVCADMAYDTAPCRKILATRGIRQCIPPRTNACLSKNNRNLRSSHWALKERDDALNYIKHNTINGSSYLARASWKRNVGYHVRSLVETAMSRLKAHTGYFLTSRTEQRRRNQAMIKCKLVNLLLTAH